MDEEKSAEWAVANLVNSGDTGERTRLTALKRDIWIRYSAHNSECLWGSQLRDTLWGNHEDQGYGGVKERCAGHEGQGRHECI